MKPKFVLFSRLAAGTFLASLPVVADDLPVSGNITVSGWGKFNEGIDIGPNSESQVNWYPAGSTGIVASDITPAQGIFLWRDTITSTPSARNKMQLDGDNVLTLFKADGTTQGVVINPELGRITLASGGANSGIYAGTTPLLTLNGSGVPVLPANAIFPNGLQLSSGQLKVVTATPAFSSTTGALTVAGGIGVGMDSCINGIRIGRGQGSIVTNTALGNGVLDLNTSGADNIAVGYHALFDNTSGSSNVALGSHALEFNNASSNTAVGYKGLYNNTSGSSNNALGYNALGLNTTGSDNTALGALSLQRNVGGSNNCAVGSNSLGYNSSGVSNTGIGVTALQNNRYGGYNTAVGFAALAGAGGSVAVLQYNAAFGSHALSKNTGSNNVGVGNRALYYQADGSGNVAIGSGAGEFLANGSSPLTAASNSIYLGTNARANTVGETNAIVIGAGAVGGGANTTVIGNSSTTTTTLFGNTTVQGTTVLTGAATMNGDTTLKGKVVIEQAQGDISMGIYGN